MSTPDPKTVREIAAKVANIALHDAVHVDQWISAVIDSDFGNECSQVRAPLHAAVARRMATVRPSWPDEQQPADVVTTEQQQDGAVEELRTFLAALPPRIDIVADWTRGGVRNVLTAEALRALLAERTARAARVAELESERTSLAVLLLAEPDEREADTRAVVEACAGVMDGTAPQPIRHEYAVQRLRARYADRIAALDADTDGGAE